MNATALKNFPTQAVLPRSKIQLAVRPLEVGDAQGLLEFFNRVPEEDRHFLKEDVTSPEVINGWVRHMDFNTVLPLVAVVDDEIVADATLHWHRSKSLKHKGEIRIVVDPRYRGQGLGTLMARHVIDAAYQSGLESVVFELVEGKEDDAIGVAERLGFHRIATLPEFVKDMEGKKHDQVVMELPLVNWLAWWAY